MTSEQIKTIKQRLAQEQEETPSLKAGGREIRFARIKPEYLDTLLSETPEQLLKSWEGLQGCMAFSSVSIFDLQECSLIAEILEIIGSPVPQEIVDRWNGIARRIDEEHGY